MREHHHRPLERRRAPSPPSRGVFRALPARSRPRLHGARHYGTDDGERFISERILPSEPEYYAALVHSPDHKQWRIPPVMERLKAEAQALGLWNLFMPDPNYGAGLDNRDYAPLAELMGRRASMLVVRHARPTDRGWE